MKLAYITGTILVIDFAMLVLNLTLYVIYGQSISFVASLFIAGFTALGFYNHGVARELDRRAGR